VTPETPIAEIAGHPPPRDPPWTLLDILLILIVLALSLMTTAAIGVAVAHRIPALRALDRATLALNPLFFVPVQFGAYLLTFIFTRMLITLRAQDDFWSAVKWDFPEGASAGVFAFAGSVLALAVQAASSFLPIPKSLPIEQYFHDAPSAYMMLVFGVLVAPLLEELLFRGLLFPVFSRALGMAGGVVATAALFALIHQGQLSHAWAPLLLLFFVGLVLTIIRARTRSLAASWITHFAYNATLFGFLFIASHGFRNFENLH
jgi:membrane protease YdiL (CAAX protease family)